MRTSSGFAPSGTICLPGPSTPSTSETDAAVAGREPPQLLARKPASRACAKKRYSVPGGRLPRPHEAEACWEKTCTVPVTTVPSSL